MKTQLVTFHGKVGPDKTGLAQPISMPLEIYETAGGSHVVLV